MKWSSVLLVPAGPVIAALGLFAEDDGIIFFGGILLFVLGVGFLFLPYEGSPEEQARRAKEDRTGVMVLFGALAALVALAILLWRMFA